MFQAEVTAIREVTTTLKHNRSKTIVIWTRTRPEFRFQSGPVPVPVEFRLVPVSFRYRLIWPVPDRYRNFFSCWIIGFLCFALISYLHHVPPSSSLALPSRSHSTSRAPLRFPTCNTCQQSFTFYYIIEIRVPPPPLHPLWRHLES